MPAETKVFCRNISTSMAPTDRNLARKERVANTYLDPNANRI